MDRNQNTGHSKQDLYWYAEWRPRIWAKIIGDTFEKIGWKNLKGKKVLELGYGGGRIAVMFARHGAKYTGYEIDSRRFDIARKTALKANVLDSIEFCLDDFMEIEGQFDYIFVKSVLFHIKDEQVYLDWLEKINSLLAVGGKFIALENGIGLNVNRWVRKYILGVRYTDALLYNQAVEKKFHDNFGHLDIKYFYVLSHLTLYPSLFTKLEKGVLAPTADNCFAVSLVCDKA